MEQFYNNIKTKIKTEKQKVKKINDELNDIIIQTNINNIRGIDEKIYFISNLSFLISFLTLNKFSFLPRNIISNIDIIMIIKLI